MALLRWVRDNGLLSAAGVALVLGVYSSSAQSQEEEPIAYVGHGAFFDASGREIEPTPEFLQRAERWYEKRIIAGAEKSADFDATASKLTRGLTLSSYERLFAKQATLSWMASNLLSDRVDGRTRGKLRALEYRMRRTLVGKGTKALFSTNRETISTELLRRVDALPVSDKVKFKSLALAPGGEGTANGGKAYVDECAAAGVPIPPPIGRMEAPGVPGWKSQGFIERDLQFIVKSPAELRSFENAQGMCYALPRYGKDDPSRVDLDGVICFSKTTAKTCFWDNQMVGKGSFAFRSGEVIPIGYPDLSIDPEGRYQAGGADLDESAGGICTDCHVGDNPYIVHPKVVLRPGTTWGMVQDSLPAFAPDPFKPLVLADWPQNAPSAPENIVPANCAGCHGPGDAGGRLPALSSRFGEYCGTILMNALTSTMPPRTPGSQLGKPDVQAYLALCSLPPPNPAGNGGK
ncbi:hypothetical protein ACCC88_21730 [Sphingomonas sp. Sphisp140]